MEIDEVISVYEVPEWIISFKHDYKAFFLSDDYQANKI